MLTQRFPVATSAIEVREATEAAIEELAARLLGELVLPDNPIYDEVRKVEDVTVDRRPLAIVRAACAADVATAVSFARDHALLLAVHSGGHSVAGHSMIDDGLVIDLS